MNWATDLASRMSHKRPTPSGVIAFAALVVALHGTAGATTMIDGSQITPNTITSLQLHDGGIKTVDLGFGSVTTGVIATGAVKASDIGAGAVGITSIASGAVTTAALAADAVDATKLKAGSVDTSALANGAVTTGKLKAGSVTSTQIADGSVKAVDEATTIYLVAHHTGGSSENVGYAAALSWDKVDNSGLTNDAGLGFIVKTAGVYQISVGVTWGADPAQGGPQVPGAYDFLLYNFNTFKGISWGIGPNNGGQGGTASTSVIASLDVGDDIGVEIYRPGCLGYFNCTQLFGSGDKSPYLTIGFLGNKKPAP